MCKEDRAFYNTVKKFLQITLEKAEEDVLTDFVGRQNIVVAEDGGKLSLLYLDPNKLYGMNDFHPKTRESVVRRLELMKQYRQILNDLDEKEIAA